MCENSDRRIDLPTDGNPDYEETIIIIRHYTAAFGEVVVDRITVDGVVHAPAHVPERVINLLMEVQNG